MSLSSYPVRYDSSRILVIQALDELAHPLASLYSQSSMPPSLFSVRYDSSRILAIEVLDELAHPLAPLYSQSSMPPSLFSVRYDSSRILAIQVLDESVHPLASLYCGFSEIFQRLLVIGIVKKRELISIMTHF